MALSPVGLAIGGGLIYVAVKMIPPTEDVLVKIGVGAIGALLIWGSLSTHRGIEAAKKGQVKKAYGLQTIGLIISILFLILFLGVAFTGRKGGSTWDANSACPNGFHLVHPGVSQQCTWDEGVNVPSWLREWVEK